MKLLPIIISIFIIILNYNAQVTSNLSQNNVNATISNSGTFFNNSSIGAPGYEVPKNSGKHCIYAASFWHGGMTDNDELLVSAQFYQANQDLFPGPFSNTDSYNDPEFLTKYNKIWTLTSDQILDHILHYTDPTYIMPSEIATWPGNGDASLGVSQQLAPFVDVNNDGFYIPSDGDYPDIKGCMASYLIMNDASNPHGSGGAIMGIEIHQMFYQYELDDFLNRTTFLEQKIINRGGQNIHDFYTTFFMDADIGNYMDDFVGCDSSRHMMYAYNGDANDESNGGTVGYGTETPSLGVISLNNNLTGSGSFSSTSGSSPNTPAEIYNTMQGLWSDGTPIYYGGNGVAGSPGVSTTPTTFIYSDNPNDPSGWSEVTQANPSGDRRSYISVYKDTLPSQAEWIQDYAILQAPEGSAQESVNYLIQKADSAQVFYQNPVSNCDNIASIEEINAEKLQLFPNPSKGTFKVSMRDISKESILKISNLDGRLVYQRELGIENQIEIELNEAPGIYMLTIDDGDSIYSKKIVLE